jgi:hypothetical protein
MVALGDVVATVFGDVGQATVGEGDLRAELMSDCEAQGLVDQRRRRLVAARDRVDHAHHAQHVAEKGGVAGRARGRERLVRRLRRGSHPQAIGQGQRKRQPCAGPFPGSEVIGGRCGCAQVFVGEVDAAGLLRQFRQAAVRLA